MFNFASNEINQTESLYSETLRQLKNLLLRSDYIQAAELGEKALVRLKSDPNCDLRPLTEVTLAWARAKVYLGKASPAISELRILRVQIIEKLSQIEDNPTCHVIKIQKYYFLLGEICNLIGYWYWKEKDDLEMAGREFSAGLGYHNMAGPSEGYATLCDNFGRGLAAQGNFDQAYPYLRRALRMRLSFGNPLRIGLSENSIAEYFLIRHRPFVAYKLIQKAYAIFKDAENWRGIGLAKIMSCRILIELAGAFPDDPTQRLHYLQKAITEGEEAAEIFRIRVTEPVRAQEASHELGKSSMELSFLEYEQFPVTQELQKMNQPCYAEL
jgi:tetratricopeptide (TPR) repeat protein